MNLICHILNSVKLHCVESIFQPVSSFIKIEVFANKCVEALGKCHILCETTVVESVCQLAPSVIKIEVFGIGVKMVEE